MAQTFLHFSGLFMQKETATAWLESTTFWLLDMSALLTEPLQLFIRSSKNKGANFINDLLHNSVSSQKGKGVVDHNRNKNKYLCLSNFSWYKRFVKNLVFRHFLGFFYDVIVLY